MYREYLLGKSSKMVLNKKISFSGYSESFRIVCSETFAQPAKNCHFLEQLT
jgi:hypothetical protein